MAGINLDQIPKTKKERKKPSSSGLILFLNKDLKLFKKKINNKIKERFYSEMGILLSSGIDIKSAFDIIIDQQKKESDKALFQQIHNGIMNGQSLSESLQLTNKFSAYEYFSIKIGEESGQITTVLNSLSSYYNRRIKQQRQLVSSLTYPVLVIVVALLVLIFMLNFIVPMFSNVFARFGNELPQLTQFVIKVSDFFRNNLGKLFTTLILIVIGFVLANRTKNFKMFVSKLILRLPYFGDLIRHVQLVRFFQSMSLLISSKTPMLHAIDLVRNMINFLPLKAALEQISKDILHGGSINQSMAKYTFFDKRIIALVKVAEEVNQLDFIFTKLYEQYSDELDHRTGMLGNVLEPVLIIGVGILVLLILVSMYLPLFQLSTSFL